MSIEIKKNEAPQLAKCEMLCDGGLHEKLNKYDLTKFMNEHSTNILAGAPKSGKTSLLYSLFKSPQLMKKVYHNIFIFMPLASRMSMKNNLFDKLPDENKFDELNFENLSEVLDRIKNEDRNYNNCIILDDQGSKLKNKELKQIFKELITSESNDEELITDSFVSAISTGPSVAIDLIKWLFENDKQTVGRYFYTQVVTTWDSGIIDEMYDAIKELIQVSDHIAFINYPAGKMWAKRLRSDLRNNRLSVSESDRIILEQISR